MSPYKDLSDWLLELAGIELSALKKYHTTLLNLLEMIWDLGAPLKIEEPVVKEVELLMGTWSKGKGCKSEVVKKTEEEKFYDLSTYF